MTIGEKIKEAREAKKLKQSELAKLIDVKSGGVISNWEKDINKPDADKIIRLCEVLDISPSFLLDFKSTNSNELSCEEKSIIKKYRALDERGKRMVSLVLDEEYEQSQQPVHILQAVARGGTFLEKELTDLLISDVDRLLEEIPPEYDGNI